MSVPLRLLINGSKGRMGQTLIACAKDDPGLKVTAEIDTGDDFAGAVPDCDVIIDFSHHNTIELVLARCVEHRKTLVIGTTGHSDAQAACIRHAAGQIPIVFAPNYSIGVNTLFWLTRRAAEILGPSFDLEVVEMHHRLKKDAPSGTPSVSRRSWRKSGSFNTTKTFGTAGTGSWASEPIKRSACTRCEVVM